MKIDIDWLEENIFLCKLSDEDQTLLGKLFEVTCYSAGDVIVKQGEPGGELYLMRSGLADITCQSGEESLRVANISEGASFGEMAFLTGDAIGATVMAKEPCVVYALSRGAYSELMVGNQDLVYSLFAHMLLQAGAVIRRMNDEQIALQKYITSRHD